MSVSVSRAYSLEVPRTAEISVVESWVPEPTSTYPAPSVCPVFTPFTQGTRLSSVLGGGTWRGWSALRRVAPFESTIRANSLLRIRIEARVTRSRGLEELAGASRAIGLAH